MSANMVGLADTQGAILHLIQTSEAKVSCVSEIANRLKVAPREVYTALILLIDSGQVAERWVEVEGPFGPIYRPVLSVTDAGRVALAERGS